MEKILSKLVIFFQRSKSGPGVDRKLLQILEMKKSRRPIEFASRRWDRYFASLLEQIEIPHWGKVQSFSPLAEGSVAKVFRVQFLTRTGAVKMIFPQIDVEIASKVSFWNRIMGFFTSFSKGFDLMAYATSLHEKAKGELNLSAEFNHQKRFEEFFQRVPEIRIPRALGMGAQGRALVSECLESLNLAEFLNAASPAQRQLANGLIIDFYLKSFFELGWIHTDPNPGNFGFRISAEGRVQLVVYDLGAVEKVNETQREGFKLWLQSALAGEFSFKALEQMGWDLQRLEPLKEKLGALSQILLEPFLKQGAYDLKMWNRKARVQALLREERWVFMSSAPVSLIGWMRAFKGLFYYGEALDEGFNLGDRLKGYNRIQSHAVERKALRELNVYREGESDRQIADLAGYRAEKQIEKQTRKAEEEDIPVELFIRLDQDNEAMVKLKFKASAICYLEDLIDPEVKSKLNEKKIYIPDLIYKAQTSGYQPQKLFEWQEGNKKLTVELRSI